MIEKLIKWLVLNYLTFKVTSKPDKLQISIDLPLDSNNETEVENRPKRPYTSRRSKDQLEKDLSEFTELIRVYGPKKAKRLYNEKRDLPTTTLGRDFIAAQRQLKSQTLNEEERRERIDFIKDFFKSGQKHGITEAYMKRFKNDNVNDFTRHSDTARFEASSEKLKESETEKDQELIRQKTEYLNKLIRGGLEGNELKMAFEDRFSDNNYEMILERALQETEELKH